MRIGSISRKQKRKKKFPRNINEPISCSIFVLPPWNFQKLISHPNLHPKSTSCHFFRSQSTLGYVSNRACKQTKRSPLDWHYRVWMGCHGGGGKRKEHEIKVITLKDGHKKKRKSGHPLSKGGKEGKKGPWETELFFVIDIPMAMAVAGVVKFTVHRMPLPSQGAMHGRRKKKKHNNMPPKSLSGSSA